MQVLPTAPSPTVTHLINLEAVEAIRAKKKIKEKILSQSKTEPEKKQEPNSRATFLEDKHKV